MSKEKIFPAILIGLNLCASAVCFFSHEPKKAVYWLAAAVLNFCVTF